MFATYNYKVRNGGQATVERAHEPSAAQGIGHQHSACANCHLKKIKCGGQRPSCERCIQKNITCTYSSGSGRKRQRVISEKQNPVPIATPPPSRQDSRRDTPTETQQTCTLSAVSNTSNAVPQAPQSGEKAAQIQSEKPNSSDFHLERAGQPDNSPLTDTSDIFSNYSQHFFQDVNDAEASIFDLPFGSPMNVLSHPDSPCSERTTGIEDRRCNGPVSTSMMEAPSLPSSLDVDMGFNLPEHLLPNMVASDIDSLGQLEALGFGKHRSGPDDVLATLPSDDGFSNGASCSCLGQASVLLEKWEERKRKQGLDGIVGLLTAQKRTMIACNALLDCKRCGRVSSSMMLPLTICRHLVSSFQAIASGGVNVDGPYQRKISFEPCADTAGDASTRTPCYSIASYQVDSLQEWRYVVGVLVLFQWKQLKKLLQRFRALASSASWETQLHIVQSLEGSLRDFAAQSQRSRRNSSA